MQKLLESFQNCSSPFDTDERKALFCLSSGKPAPPEVMEDLLECEQRGISAFNNFVQQRLMEKSVSFHSPMKKLSLKTFSYTHVKTKVQSTKNKTVQIAAQRNIFGQLLVLAREHDISLEKALTYPMSPVPWALANPDGLPVKTDKAKLMHMLEKHVDFEHPQLESCTFVIDGNAMLQSLVGLPGTFGELAQKIFSLLPKSERVDFVTDTYQEHSIKASERARRGTTETFLLKGPLTKIPKDWKGFLSNGQNKMEVMKLVLSEWQKTDYASKLKGRRIYFTTGHECTCLFSEDGLTVSGDPQPDLHSVQEEADTKIILHCCHQVNTHPSSQGIVVRSPDTDVFILLLYHVRNIQHQVFLDIGVGNKRRLLNISKLEEMHGREQCDAVLGLHAFSGCDSTSSFVRKGKITVLKKFRKDSGYCKTFASLGSLNLENDFHDGIEQFVCCLYGRPKYTSVDKLRYDLCLEKFQTGGGSGPLSACDGTDLSLLPPCKTSLRLHTERANYQTLIWKNAHIQTPDIPSPVGKGWQEDESGLQIQWTEGDILPGELVDILCEVEPDFDTEEQPPQLGSLADAVFQDGCDISSE